MQSKIRISTPKSKSGLQKKSQENFRWQSNNFVNKLPQTNNANNFFLGNLHERQNTHKYPTGNKDHNNITDSSDKLKSKSFLNKTHGTYNTNLSNSVSKKFKDQSNVGPFASGMNNNTKNHKSMKLMSLNNKYVNPEKMVASNMQGYEKPNRFNESVQVSTSEIGVVKAYSVVTTDGIFRKTNEDRVSILQNIVSKQPQDEKCSFFGIYDGHGGNLCSEFLKENLHKFILKNKFYPSNPTESIKAGIQMADKYFLEEVTAKYPNVNAGSCAIFQLVLGPKIYIANVGDSRQIGSYRGGKNIKQISRDHKPCDKLEYERVIKGGGQVYQSQLKGPYRIFPGRQSVSRSLGDAQAKLISIGGNPNVQIADPEIYILDLSNQNEKLDFQVMGSDGLFDKLTNEEICDCVWNIIKNNSSGDQHTQAKFCSKALVKKACDVQSQDNITCQVVQFNIDKVTQDQSYVKVVGKNMGMSHTFTSGTGQSPSPNLQKFNSGGDINTKESFNINQDDPSQPFSQLSNNYLSSENQKFRKMRESDNIFSKNSKEMLAKSYSDSNLVKNFASRQGNLDLKENIHMSNNMSFKDGEISGRDKRKLLSNTNMTQKTKGLEFFVQNKRPIRSEGQKNSYSINDTPFANDRMQQTISPQRNTDLKDKFMQPSHSSSNFKKNMVIKNSFNSKFMQDNKVKNSNFGVTELLSGTHKNNNVNSNNKFFQKKKAEVEVNHSYSNAADSKNSKRKLVLNNHRSKNLTFGGSSSQNSHSIDHSKELNRMLGGSRDKMGNFGNNMSLTDDNRNKYS